MRDEGYLLDSITTDSGVIVNFHDNTNRYFGDFHRVSITVTICRPENNSLKKSSADPDYETTLDRMAVPGTEIIAVREQLIRNFIENALPYMGKEFFEELKLRHLRPGIVR